MAAAKTKIGAVELSFFLYIKKKRLKIPLAALMAAATATAVAAAKNKGEGGSNCTYEELVTKLEGGYFTSKYNYLQFSQDFRAAITIKSFPFHSHGS